MRHQCSIRSTSMLVDLINEHHPFISSFHIIYIMFPHRPRNSSQTSEFPFRKFLVSMLNSFIHEMKQKKFRFLYKRKWALQILGFNCSPFFCC